MNWRKRLYEIIEVAGSNDRVSYGYDILIMTAIIISLVPLAYKEDNLILTVMDRITAALFIMDYIFRLITADFKLGKSRQSFLVYPFTPMALIDLLAILPTLLGGQSKGLRLLRLIRFVRFMKIFRFFKFLRYSRSLMLILHIIQKQRKAFASVCFVAGGYILIAALVIYNVEPETFLTFFDALYWAVMSLTTVGYGDIYPVSLIGRCITIISSVLGIAIIALPSGIITAGYMDELHQKELLEQQEVQRQLKEELAKMKAREREAGKAVEMVDGSKKEC